MEYKSLHFSKSQTSILKHLYTILTDDNEILLILFNQLYCGKDNIKNVELSYDQKHLTLLIGDVDETSKNIIEKKYTLYEEYFNIKKRKIVVIFVKNLLTKKPRMRQNGIREAFCGFISRGNP